jgi:hypothetical protein
MWKVDENVEDRLRDGKKYSGIPSSPHPTIHPNEFEEERGCYIQK